MRWRRCSTASAAKISSTGTLWGVLLCWLALLLIRIAENEIPTHTWRRLREELQTLHVGQFTGNAGHVHQRTELTPAQRDILRALQIPEPPRFLQLTTAD